MKIKIIDKCCNEFVELEIKNEDMARLGQANSMVEIAPAKIGHSIIIHTDMTIEYVPSNQPYNLSDKR